MKKLWQRIKGWITPYDMKPAFPIGEQLTLTADEFHTLMENEEIKAVLTGDRRITNSDFDKITKVLGHTPSVAGGLTIV